ncbi:ATP-grasp domain-containing protein [bacterium]|nr:ATP-grasp domain-containing protein [bacterium]
MRKLNVGVFFGGLSIEREVSFNSGRTICDHLDTELYNVIPLFQSIENKLYILPFSFLYRGKIADFAHRLDTQARQVCWDELPQLVDFVYIATHGLYAEDGRLQGMLELLKIPYLGSKVFASAVSMHKSVYKEMLGDQVCTPRGFELSAEQIQNFDEQFVHTQMQKHAISFPCIVKPVSEGSSFGVTVVHAQENLYKALQFAAFVSGPQGQSVLVEEKIEGMEFTCIMLTDYKTGKVFALPPTEIIINAGAHIFDYEQKYMPGRVMERTPPACGQELIEKIQQTCITTMELLEIKNMARIDGFLTRDNQVCIIDVNPLSGMAPSSFLFRQAAEIGMHHAQLINHLIKTDLQQIDMNYEKEHKELIGRMRVGVIMGGPSNERETSLDSGRNVCYKLSHEKYEVIPLFADKNMHLYKMTDALLVHTSTREVTENLHKATRVQWSDLPKEIDFAFLALHGAPGENGVVQGALEMLQIPYNGPGVFTSALCMDKFKTNNFLRSHGIAVPANWLVSKTEYLGGMDIQKVQTFLDQSGGACIVKPHDDGCSVMVHKAESVQEIVQALALIFETKEYALLEEYIVGMELTVGVVGNSPETMRALAPSQSIAKKGVLSMEEKFLPGAGENQTPAQLAPEDIVLVQEAVKNAFIAVRGCGYSRIDCFFQNEMQSPTGKKRVVILEINTLPALTPATCLFHQAAEEGLRPTDLLDEIIMLGKHIHKKYEAVSVDTALDTQEQTQSEV